MYIYCEEYIIYGDYVFEEWDLEFVVDFIDWVNLYNMCFDFVIKNFDKNSFGNILCCFLIVYYFGKYSCRNVLFYINIFLMGVD